MQKLDELIADFRVADVMEIVILNGYSRLPVMDDEKDDDVLGLAFAKDLMTVERSGGGRTSTPRGRLAHA